MKLALSLLTRAAIRFLSRPNCIKATIAEKSDEKYGSENCPNFSNEPGQSALTRRHLSMFSQGGQTGRR